MSKLVIHIKGPKWVYLHNRIPQLLFGIFSCLGTRRRETPTDGARNYYSFKKKKMKTYFLKSVQEGSGQSKKSIIKIATVDEQFAFGG